MHAPVFRLAERVDTDAVSRLLVQLYACEAPGMLTGPLDGQVELARRMVAATPLDGRYVLQRDGLVIATGALATREAPRPNTPASVVLAAPSIVGPVAGVRTILGAVRGLSTIAPGPGPDEALLHSVVVDERMRRERLGEWLLNGLESEALRRRKRRAVLQVLQDNTLARRFYTAHGYTERPARPGTSLRMLAYASVLMHKPLDA